MTAAARRPGVVPRPVVRAVLRSCARPLLGPRVPVAVQRRGLDLLSGVPRLPVGTRVSRVRLGGRPAERVELPRADTARAVLCLHGGGYVTGSPRTHRALAAHLAAATRAPVYVLDYRLAPEHPYPAALDDATDAYQALLAQGHGPQNPSLVGDSAGGGLALALALRLRARSLPPPGALALLSPWLDLTLSAPGDPHRDPLLRLSWLRWCATGYAANADPAAPELSPLFADLTGLPPMLVHVGSDEVLRPDTERLVTRAEQAGIPCQPSPPRRPLARGAPARRAHDRVDRGRARGRPLPGYRAATRPDASD